MGVFCAGGQLQIILGTGTVNRVYEEFIKLSGLPGAPAAQKCTAPVLPLPQRLAAAATVKKYCAGRKETKLKQ